MAKGLKYALEIIDKNFGVGIQKAKKETEQLDNQVNKVNRSFGAVGKTLLGLFAVNRIMAFGTELQKVIVESDRLNTSLMFNSKSGEGIKNIEFLNTTIKDLKLNFQASQRGFEEMNSKMTRAGISGEVVRKSFEGIGTAALVMRATDGQLEAMLGSVGALAEKGVIKFNDFENLIGNKIPGALRIAANAMNVSEATLVKMFESGKITADKFLPAFADQLKETFSEGTAEALNSMQAAMNNRKNMAWGLWKELGNMFEPIIIKFQNGAARIIEYIRSIIPHLEPVKQAFWNLVVALDPLWSALQKVMLSFGGSKGAAEGLAKVINVVANVVEVLATGFGWLLEVSAPLIPWIVGAIAVQWAWNIAMAANPIGLIILGIGALIGLIIKFNSNMGGFTNVIETAWVAVIGFGTVLKDHMLNVIKGILEGIKGIGQAIILMAEGDLKKGVKSAVDALGDISGLNATEKTLSSMKDLGKKTRETYLKGVKEADEKAEHESNAAKKEYEFLQSANDKTFGSNISQKLQYDGSYKNTNANVPALSASGRTEKHTTFNIQSMVKELTVVTNALGASPEEIKRQLQNIFSEMVADLEIRADA